MEIYTPLVHKLLILSVDGSKLNAVALELQAKSSVSAVKDSFRRRSLFSSMLSFTWSCVKRNAREECSRRAEVKRLLPLPEIVVWVWYAAGIRFGSDTICFGPSGRRSVCWPVFVIGGDIQSRRWSCWYVRCVRGCNVRWSPLLWSPLLSSKSSITSFGLRCQG